MTGNQAPTSHPVVEQPGAKLCKMGQDIKILQEFATPLFYHTSARYVSRNLTKVRLLVKQQYHLPRCTSSTIRTASWRLHATRAKGKWRLETRTDRGKQLLQEIANPSTDLVMLRNIQKYEKPAVTPWWFLVSLMRRRRAQASSSKANKLGGRDWKWASIGTLHFNIVIVRSQPSKLIHWISGPSHILRFLGNATQPLSSSLTAGGLKTMVELLLLLPGNLFN